MLTECSIAVSRFNACVIFQVHRIILDIVTPCNMSRFAWDGFELTVTVNLPVEDLESVTEILMSIATNRGWYVTIGVLEHTSTA